MILTKHGSIFDSRAQVLVCPVNCVGVMGKGLALEFKKRRAHACKDYFWACEKEHMIAGDVLDCGNVWFAFTKADWRNASKIEWIEKCLIAIAYMPPLSIALPQLGCGCGGLDWADVWPLYEKHLGELDCDVEVWIHE
jgi:O-acetyl-ADP-ribose deacetylase (regulator of RNase III)